MFEPGQVVAVPFPGAVETKRRPAIVLSSIAYHSCRPDIIVGLVTSRSAAALLPTDCALHDWQQAGLRLPSTFRAFVMTVPNVAVSKVIGRLSHSDWAAVCACLRTALADLPGGEETPADEPTQPAR